MKTSLFLKAENQIHIVPIHSAYILQLHLHAHLILILAEKKRDVTLKGIIFFQGALMRIVGLEIALVLDLVPITATCAARNFPGQTF